MRCLLVLQSKICWHAFNLETPSAFASSEWSDGANRPDVWHSAARGQLSSPTSFYTAHDILTGPTQRTEKFRLQTLIPFLAVENMPMQGTTEKWRDQKGSSQVCACLLLTAVRVLDVHRVALGHRSVLNSVRVWE